MAEPGLSFQKHSSTSSFQVSAQTYLKDHPHSEFNYIATGAVVFDNPDSAFPRILLLQRGAHDSLPNRWEIPGGACDDEDESILHGVARELWEESGFEASFAGPVIGDVQLFTSSSGKRIGKFMFYVEIGKGEDGKVPEVKLDPNEHQDFVWVSEDEVKAKRKGDLDLEFTTAKAYDAILKAFALQKKKNVN